MAEIGRMAAYGKLNSTCFKALDRARALCLRLGNPFVEIQHWLIELLREPESDLTKILEAYGISRDNLDRALATSLRALPAGAASLTDLSSHVDLLMERGWITASLLYGRSEVRSGDLILGALKSRDLRGLLANIDESFAGISADDLSNNFLQVVEGSPEDTDHQTSSEALHASTQSSGTNLDPDAPGASALARYATDLTAQARQGKIDPVIGRDREIRQIVDILMRRRQNNPILTGEAGVGKTAVVEGFALKVASGNVPPALREIAIWTLDIGLLQAGASVRGEFENRLRKVVEEVQSSPKPIVLFIDEAHTLIGAGGAAGTGDAANLLKPALARGTLRTIAATTWAEYRRHIEKDPALARRFQAVQVHEPIEERAVTMMRGIASTLEKHHRVKILDEALTAAVALSHRYIPGRQLPDKAVSLLDTACARVSISQHATPPVVEDAQRRLDGLRTELEIVLQEKSIGIEALDRQQELNTAIAADEAQLKALEVRWESEKNLSGQILQLRSMLLPTDDAKDGAPSAPVQAGGVSTNGDSSADALNKLKALQSALSTLQGDSPLMLTSVDAAAVGTVVSDWTGVPVRRMLKDEIHSVLRMAETLNERVIGQRHALDIIVRRIQTSRANLDNATRPVGVFMLCGPSGVGKTETALTLADALYGTDESAITINMSEFSESHSVSTLKGAPPGYVGYGEGGKLTEAVRRRPYSVVLLDEFEKAHPMAHQLFFQAFDKGWMEDGEGRFIDFRNTVIILTTNVGADVIASLCKDPVLVPDIQALEEALTPPLRKVFPAALLGRLIVIPYYPLSGEMLGQIVQLQLKRIGQRIYTNHKAEFSYDQAAVDLIVKRCNIAESGGRVIEALLTNTVLPRISIEFLERMSTNTPLAKITLSAAEGDFAYSFA